MKQHEILSEINTIDVKHSSLLSDFMEYECGEKSDGMYSQLLALEKRANELLKQLNIKS